MRRFVTGAVSLICLCSALGSQRIFAAEPANKAQEPSTTKEGPPSIESKFLTNIRQVTSGMEKAGEGYFSPDGKEIIYQAVPLNYPFYQIYKQSLSGGEPQRISPGRGRTTCSYFSPDGKGLIFASSHLDPQAFRNRRERAQTDRRRKSLGQASPLHLGLDPYMDIFASDLNGKHLKQLTDSPGYDAEGAYSRDGKLIAFCSDRDGDPDIYVMNADGSHVRQLTNAKGYDGGPFISPNGKWVDLP